MKKEPGTVPVLRRTRCSLLTIAPAKIALLLTSPVLATTPQAHPFDHSSPPAHARHTSPTIHTDSVVSNNGASPSSSEQGHAMTIPAFLPTERDLAALLAFKIPLAERTLAGVLVLVESGCSYSGCSAHPVACSAKEHRGNWAAGPVGNSAGEGASVGPGAQGQQAPGHRVSRR